MIKLNRMTDYGVMIIVQVCKGMDRITTAPNLSSTTGLPLPTVSKILKKLAKKGLITSHRGVNGGYSQRRPLSQISVAEMIEALDGPVVLTACVEGAEHSCNVESLCPVRGGWDRVNTAIRNALEEISLEELCMPARLPEVANNSDTDEFRRGVIQCR
tara:strand:- start:457 stop:930 length:474 start_codon:yes stop_codon:yes gene_type:complete